MSEELVNLFEWNAWANRRYCEVFSKMEFNSLNMDTPYGNLLDRIVHIFASFEMWYKRMNGVSPRKVIRSDDFSTWENLQQTWIQFDELLLNYVRSITKEELETKVSYTSLDGSVYTRQIRHILLHLTAHPNYHRGQISSIFIMNYLYITCRLRACHPESRTEQNRNIVEESYTKM